MSSKRGFSLLELMIVLSLSGLFLGAIQESMVMGLRTVSAADKREDVRMQLIRALDRFTREAALADNVDRALDARFQFDTPSVNNVNYVYTSGSGTLTRQDATLSSAVTILSNLTAFDFNYVEQNATASQATCDSTSSCGSNCCRSEARVVQVTMTAASGQETISVSGSVYLRNM